MEIQKELHICTIINTNAKEMKDWQWHWQMLKKIQRILLSGYPRDCLKECDQGCLGKLKQEDTLTSVIKIWFVSVQKTLEEMHKRINNQAANI